MKHLFIFLTLFIIKFAALAQSKSPQDYIGKKLVALSYDKRYHTLYVVKDKNKPMNAQNLVYKETDKTETNPDSLAGKVFDFIGYGEYDSDFSFFKLNSASTGTIFYLYKNFAFPQYLVTQEEYEQILAAKKSEARKLKAKKKREADSLQVATMKQNELNKSKLDSLRNLYVNKTVWLRYWYIQPKPDTEATVFRQNFKLSALKVIDIVQLKHQFGYSAYVQTVGGLKGYIDFYTQKNNRVSLSRPLKDIVFFTDPVVTYKLTPVQLKAIKKGDVHIGMNKTVIRLIKGEPETINTTTYSFGVHEQWVYYSSYYYFENGKLTAIQN